MYETILYKLVASFYYCYIQVVRPSIVPITHTWEGVYNQVQILS